MSLSALFLWLCAPMIGASGPAEALPAARFWLRVYEGPRAEAARRVRGLLSRDRPNGGRLRRVVLRTGQGSAGATVHQVLFGPFARQGEALRAGLALRRDVRFARAGLRLHGLAVVLAPSYQPVRLKPLPAPRSPDPSEAPRMRLGDLVVPRGYGFVTPTPRLPALASALVRLDPFRPLVLLGERTLCDGSDCLRWFETLRPRAIQTVWVPAYWVAPHDRMRRFTVADGAGTTRARGALWAIGRARGGPRYRVMFRRGSLPPQLFVVTIPDRYPAPFRLVVDRHGPGIYDAAGRVVARVSLGPWIYKRPPLWRAPTSSPRARRRRRQAR